MSCCRFYKYSRPSISQCVKSQYTPLEAPVIPYSEQGAVPESIRMETARCPTYIIPCGQSSSPCINDPGARCTTTSKVPVSNLTLSSSEYIAQIREQTLFAATDPANPETRFEQYFRPKPPQPDDLIICPERIPNPAPPERPCVGFSRFAGSTPNVN